MFYELTIPNTRSKSPFSLSTVIFASGSIILAGAALIMLFPDQSLLNLSWMLLVLILATGLCLYLYRKNKVTFLKIDDDCISFFDDTEKLHSVKINDITAINSGFCLVQIYTKAEVFALDMSLIRKEKQRWEVKELIRRIVPVQFSYSATG